MCQCTDTAWVAGLSCVYTLYSMSSKMVVSHTLPALYLTWYVDAQIMKELTGKVGDKHDGPG